VFSPGTRKVAHIPASVIVAAGIKA